MQGKHTSTTKYWIAWLYREWIRRLIRKLAHWVPLANPEPGCTAIIGMCSRLSDVMVANLLCLHKSRWPALKRVVIVVDAVRNESLAKIEIRAKEICTHLDVDFLYYSEDQVKTASRLQLPFVYSWLSWCLAIARVTTEHILIHDYDALIIGDTLHHRYNAFVNTKSKIQGVAWYGVNGLLPTDRLATTFEAFVDTSWLRAMPPIALFNKMARKGTRSVDYDTLLAAQDRQLLPSQRTMVPMNLTEMIHPSQMIHQYTMFRRHPHRPLPCFSVPMIPFFQYLSGKKNAISIATNALLQQPRSNVDFLEDGTQFNFQQLDIPQVDWALKQTVQGFIALERPPDNSIYRYGEALYSAIGTPREKIWLGDFSATQRVWIEDSAASISS